ncbi:TPA: hypothetical protein IAA92_03875 [Candidatus Galligastranaerophilus intestinigallinarum]|nr:hypothetical protein [Candidatus Galligastranaerophilus intestinigallinarum]
MAFITFFSIVIVKDWGLFSASSIGVCLNFSMPVLKHFIPLESTKSKIEEFKMVLFKSF